MQTVQVISAVALTPSQINELKAILKNKLGKAVEVKNSVNKSIIAGLYIVIGDKVVDTTIRTKIEKLKEKLLK